MDVKYETETQVLVVDDEEEVRDVLNKIVKKLGYRPLEANSVAKALNILAKEQISLMLLDICLKGATGLDLLKTLQRRQAPVPTVVVSGHISDAMAYQLLQFGVQNLISKPFEISRIASEIQKVIQPTASANGSVSQPATSIQPFSVTQMNNAESLEAEAAERRETLRVGINLPVRARISADKPLYMKMIDISTTGMQTYAKNLEVLKLGVAEQRFIFEILVVARLMRINSISHGRFTIGWEFDRIIQKYGDASIHNSTPYTAGDETIDSNFGLSRIQEEEIAPEPGTTKTSAEATDATKAEDAERREALRIGLNLPIRAKAGNGKFVDMKLIDISATGMQTFSENLEILELKRFSADRPFVFEIPLAVRMAWTQSLPDGRFAIGWEFEHHSPIPDFESR